MIEEIYDRILHKAPLSGGKFTIKEPYTKNIDLKGTRRQC